MFGAVAQTGFSARLEQHLGRPVVAACAVRPPNSIAYTAGGAGLGAAVGTVVGDLLIAGVVVGVLLGNLLQWLTIRGSGLSLSMALVLTDDHLELVRLGLLGGKRSATARTIPYADLLGAEMRVGLLQLGLRLRTAQDEIRLDAGRWGRGAAPPVIDELRRRIAA